MLKSNILAVTPLMLITQRRLTVTPVSHAVGGNSNILVFVLFRLFPLLPKPLVVLDKLHQLLYPLTDVHALVLPILIYRVVNTRQQCTEKATKIQFKKYKIIKRIKAKVITG